ncbi:MAG: 2-isopropylmalate synthase [SAR324 cluster bacterium]|uniref:2-isopropylmalate synthase n=1 Tax=SAR324 cluster bacterium TaxID=2024889 RepID=A0A2A4T1F0_9DELT|nr:MAG: 2-isopropylmalate synthase [SAR324 cluster bacterium]
MGSNSRKVQLMDTTLRDGEQTQGVSFPPAEKVNIAKAMLKSLKVDRIEVASARVSDGEKKAVASINQWAAEEGLLGQVEVLGFVDHTKSVDWIIDTGGKVLNLLAKGSEKHCREQLKKTLSQHLSDIKETISYAQQNGLTVNVYLEDWSNGYLNSPEYVFAFVSALSDCDIQHFMLPDTLGVMSPDEVYRSLKDMVSRFPNQQFDFHPHNDYGLATANAVMAVKAGVASIHCTINCLGERAGNASLAEVAVVLKDKLGMQLAIDESNIHKLSQIVENFSGKRVADNTPIVGADVFTQTSGIHADGDKKGGLYQTDLSPERFDRKRSYALGKMSGKASLLKNIEELGLNLSPENQETVLKRIVALGDSKEVITPEDLPFIIADVLESGEYNHLELLDCSTTSGFDLESTASIRVKLFGEVHKTSGSGNGGFDAFIMAIKKVLQHRQFDFPKLVDYEVRIPKGGKTNALTECTITWLSEDGTSNTRGVHSNQVFASILATLRMINMKLQKEQETEKSSDS